MLDSHLKLLGDSAVQTLSGNGRGHIHLAVKFRCNPHYKLSEKWRVRGLPTLLTKGQVFIDGIMEAWGSSLTLSPRNVITSRVLITSPVEDWDFALELNLANVPFVFNHAVTPASIRNQRIDFAAPLSASVFGCGL